MLARYLALLLVLAACGGSTAPDRPVSEVLDAAGANFNELASVRFTIDVAGGAVYLDDAETLAATSAEGQYLAPESFQAIVEVTAFDLATQVGAISIGPTRWVTNPVTGEWGELPEGIGFDPLQLFDPTIGVAATLREMVDPEIATDGDDYVVSGTVGGRRVRTLTAGLLEAEGVPIDVLIDGTTLQIEELRFTVGDGDWTIAFSEYDEPVTIDPPI